LFCTSVNSVSMSPRQPFSWMVWTNNAKPVIYCTISLFVKHSSMVFPIFSYSTKPQGCFSPPLSHDTWILSDVPVFAWDWISKIYVTASVVHINLPSTIFLLLIVALLLVQSWRWFCVLPWSCLQRYL
jgi:hypothetical protein